MLQILILGAGSMGCLMGGYLARAGHGVFLVDAVAARVDAIAERGITVEGVGGDFEVQVAAGMRYEGAAPDLMIVAVKAYDTERAMVGAEAWVGEDTTVLTLQNGLGNIEQIAHHVGRERIVAGTTSVGANLLRPAHVHHAGEGDTFVGDLAGEDLGRAELVARLLTEARLPTTPTSEVRRYIWQKLAVNVGINALTALLRVRNGRLLAVEDASEVMQEAVAECAAVAQASGIPLEPEAAAARCREVARLTASNRSSMLMDVLGGRRTEIDAINGAVVRRGEELEVPTPVNATLARLVRSLEQMEDQRER